MMRSCEEIGRLLSESMDRKLSFGQRLEVWIHLSMCRLCSGFARMLKALRQAVRQGRDRLELDVAGQPVKLSGEARARIVKTVQQRLAGE